MDKKPTKINSVLYRILVVVYLLFSIMLVLCILFDWIDKSPTSDKVWAVVIFIVATEVLRGAAYYIRTGEYQSLILSLFKRKNF